MEQKEKSPLEQLIVWAETASKQSIIDKAHELMKIERMEVKSQRLVELMQVLEMIEYLLQNGNTITPDSFVIRTAVRLAIGMDALNNEKEDLSESVAKILNASNCVEKAIDFADWLDKLTPSQRVSFWSKNGESKGLFTMDNEQLFEKFIKLTFKSE